MDSEIETYRVQVQGLRERYATALAWHDDEECADISRQITDVIAEAHDVGLDWRAL